MKFENKSHDETSDEINSKKQFMDSRAAPEDKNNIAYYMMILFGIGVLMPWNAVLTALDFFGAKVLF